MYYCEWRWRRCGAAGFFGSGKGVNNGVIFLSACQSGKFLFFIFAALKISWENIIWLFFIFIYLLFYFLLFVLGWLGRLEHAARAHIGAQVCRPYNCTILIENRQPPEEIPVGIGSKTRGLQCTHQALHRAL
jgi:hypothetical protein